MVNIEKFSKYLQNESFATFNFISDIQKKNVESILTTPFTKEYEINEIKIIKLTTERMLFKYANIIKDLIDCKNIGSKICLEGLNGFLVVENEELVLYSIYRFMARDGSHNLYMGI